MKIKPKKIQQYSMNKNIKIAKGIAMAIFFGLVSNSVMSQETGDENSLMAQVVASKGNITHSSRNTSLTGNIRKPGVQHMHRVVIQFSTADTLEHKGLMNNLKHLKEGWGDSVEVEVVVHGPGIDLLTKGKTTQQDAIQKMMKKQVKFVLCQNTMKQRNVTKEQILEGVEFVPMAIGEIILKQEQGWTYIKGGF